VTFPELALAGMVVAAGIFALDQFSPTSAWLLTVLILLMVAMRYQKFSSELAGLVSFFGTGPNQDPNFDPTLPSIPLNSTSP
jgi:preprotein translocase subunit Sec61beta